MLYLVDTLHKCAALCLPKQSASDRYTGPASIWAALKTGPLPMPGLKIVVLLVSFILAGCVWFTPVSSHPDQSWKVYGGKR